MQQPDFSIISLATSTSSIERRYAGLLSHWCARLITEIVPENNRDRASLRVLSNLKSRGHGIEFEDDECFAEEDNEKKPVPRISFASPEVTDEQPLGLWLRDFFGLSEQEHQLLVFAALLSESPTLRILCDTAERMTSRYVLLNFLSHLLEIPFASVRKALARTGSLLRLDLISPEDWSPGKSLRSFMYANDALVLDLFCAENSSSRLRELFVHEVPESDLTPDDFQWLGEDFDLLSRYLSAARERHTGNVHILLYGPPGVGKSELARVVAKACGYRVLGVPGKDEDGDPLRVPERVRVLSRYQQMQGAKGDALVIYDEAEDVFNQPIGSARGQYKQWLNGLLETGQLPVIWVCNSTEDFDPATLRRFDLHLAMIKPPLEARTAMLRKLSAGTQWSEEAVADFHRLEQVTPAHIANAVKVARHLGDKSTEDQAIVRLIDRALHRGDAQYNGNRKQNKELYSTQMINTSKPVASLLQGLQRNSSARLCFYGVSGAGKTAFARHIAEHLGRPLLIRSSSDLLGSYIGQTEARIAKAFQEAERDGAVLLMDEVDSFLPSRERAQRHYECSMVNEMLVQMERFSGVLIGTTNRLEQMDSAVLRRFDIKLEFYPLNAEQLEQMFISVCREFGLDPVEDELGQHAAMRRLKSCAAVVPGHFATARRKLKLYPETVTLKVLADAVAEEAEASGSGAGRPIGFTAWG